LNKVRDELLKQCRGILLQKIDETKAAIHLLQDSANEETKSTAGDKYETGRAMAQIEIENMTAQLNEAVKGLRILEGISGETRDHIHLGAITRTTMGNYFLAISLGQVCVNDINYFTISPASPIGTKLIGLKAGDKFVFNKKDVEILEVS
jgi:hypothetical protein